MRACWGIPPLGTARPELLLPRCGATPASRHRRAALDAATRAGALPLQPPLLRGCHAAAPSAVARHFAPRKPSSRARRRPSRAACAPCGRLPVCLQATLTTACPRCCWVTWSGGQRGSGWWRRAQTSCALGLTTSCTRQGCCAGALGGQGGRGGRRLGGPVPDAEGQAAQGQRSQRTGQRTCAC